MPDRHISDLDQANALQGAELIPCDQNSATRVTSPLAILTYILNSINSGQIAESGNLFFTNARADARVAIHSIRTDNPHGVTAAQLGLSNVNNIKNNYAATTDPGAANDSSGGYTIGSVWVNVTADTIFVCTDASLGSALWRDLTNISLTKAMIGLGLVENTALSTWAGTTNITNIGLSAITAWLGSINHDALLNYSSNKHIDHSGVNLTAGEGLTGGGSILASRTLAMDVNGLTAMTDPVDAATDKFLLYDTSAAAHKSCKLSEIAGYGRLLRVTLIPASGTWTPGVGTANQLVEVYGGGGGGGGVGNSAGADFAGGGGAGGYARLYITGVIAPQTVTIGAGGAGGVGSANGSTGGTTSFGAYLSATGGQGGGFMVGGAGTTAFGGVGGIGSSGDVNYKGGQGFKGNFDQNYSGAGGGVFGGGADPVTTGNANGNAAPANSGAGGSGARSTTSSGAWNGGAGGTGYVIVWEFA